MSWFRLVNLKKIRIIVSLFFFLSISLLFIDPWNSIPAPVSNIFVSLQLIPSITKILVNGSLTAIGLLIVVGLTIAFGRIYCSTICPIGTLQDIVIYIEKKIHRCNHFEYKKPPFLYHYSIGSLTVVLALTCGITLINLLEPFSNYGRILTNTVEPIVTFINNVVADYINKSQVYLLYNIPLRIANSCALIIIPVLFLFIVVYMSYKHGRLFCNSLCPTGAILGLISRYAFFKILIDRNACNNCGICEKVCKANCIKTETKRIDFSACIGCFNCIRSCPTDGVIYSKVPTNINVKELLEYNPSRRKFFVEVTTPAIGFILPTISATDSTSISISGYQENRNRPIAPPGSISIRHYSNLCTACHLCVSACPTQVLYPSFLDYGIAGIFQPKMNYDASYCNYECTVCSQVCPTGAILPLDIDTKKLVQIGKSIFAKDDCIVVVKKKDCAACSEHCPTKAVHMIPYEGNLKIPELNNDICTGCGACEHACPTTPRKAIYVKGNSFHLTAKKPEVKKQENIFDSKQDFPF